MTTDSKTLSTNQWLVVEGIPGLTIAPSGTPLTRLHYFDGKFLRASDLELEQNAQRRLVQLSNQAGGFGIVHGFDTRLLVGDMLEVGPGQAIDAAGKVLLLPMDVKVAITELIERSQQLASKPSAAAKSVDKAGESFCECASETSAPSPGAVVAGGALWLITIAHAEFLCGEEEVYGKLCEQACVSSTERAFRVEGVVLRARPLTLTSPLISSTAVPMSAKHLRSRVASAYFADERGRPASLISGAGLRSKAWCLGADLAEGEVPLGVLCRQGASNQWFDAWTARRERMDGPPRDYWAHRMAMRPWREYLVQILQFQCQLAELLCTIVNEGGQLIEPCAEDKARIAGARDAISLLLAKWAEAGVDQAGKIGAITVDTLAKLEAELGKAGSSSGSGGSTSGQHVLIDGGIVELPPAGYLPVDPTSDLSVNDQVRRLLGDGVDLRFCVVRPDDVAREIEGAQHMDRISLLAGLDDPNALPPVDILVPEGQIVEATSKLEGLSFRAKLGVGEIEDAFQLAKGFGENVTDTLFAGIQKAARATRIRLRGAARASKTLAGGGAAHIAALLQPKAMVGLDIDKLGPISKLKDTNETLGKKLIVKPIELEEKVDVEANPYQPNAFYKKAAKMEDSLEAVEIDVPGSMGVWFDMSASADPFAIALGSSLSASFDLRAVVAGKLASYQLVGQVQILQRKPLNFGGADLGVAALGKFTGYESMVGIGSADGSASSEYKVTLLDLRPSGSVDGLVIALTPVKGKALLDNDAVVAWDGETLDVSGLWTFVRLEPNPNQGQDPRQLVVTALDHDEAVQDASDPDHVAALQALQLIANELGDPDFATLAAAKLFPPPVDPASDLTIAATRDWVAFHARHQRICTPPLRPSKPLVTRRYQVYALEVPNQDVGQMIVEALEKDGEQLDEYDFVDIGAVEYAPGVASLQTAAAIVTTLWKTQGEGKRLAWAGIASTGPAAAEGDAIGLGRLLALEQVIEKTSPPIDEQESVVLDQVAHVFSIGDGAGAIVLLTTPVVERVTISLFFADIHAIEIYANPDQGNVDEMLVESKALHLGEFEFGLESAELLSISLDQPIAVQGIKMAYMFTQVGDAGLPVAEMLDKQASVASNAANIGGLSGIARREFSQPWQARWGRVIVIACGYQADQPYDE